MPMRKYKLPIEPTIPFKIRPQDILYPQRMYRTDYRQAVESGQFCDYDSFIIDIAEKGNLAEYIWLAFYGYNFSYNSKELYVFMRRWGLVGNKNDRRFQTIADEVGLKTCGDAEYYAKAGIRRAYERFNKGCSRVKSFSSYRYEQWQKWQEEKIAYEI